MLRESPLILYGLDPLMTFTFVVILITEHFPMFKTMFHDSRVPTLLESTGKYWKVLEKYLSTGKYWKVLEFCFLVLESTGKYFLWF